MLSSGRRVFLTFWITWFLLLFSSTVFAVHDVLSLISSQVAFKKSSKKSLHRSSSAEDKGMFPYLKEVSHLNDASEWQVQDTTHNVRLTQHHHQDRSLSAKGKENKEMGKSGKRIMEKGKGKEMGKNGRGKDENGNVFTKGKTKGGMEMATSAPIIAPFTSPVMSSPASMPVSGPTVAAPIVGVPSVSPQIVRVTDYYIAFVAPDATREPTQDEYDEMLRRITAYFKEAFTGNYASDPNTKFLDVVSSYDFSLYGDSAGIPDARFNIYMNFDYSDFTFTTDSLVVPTTAEIFQIMQNAIVPDFILEVVRTFTGSPFESTNEVFFDASEFNGPP